MDKPIKKVGRPKMPDGKRVNIIKAKLTDQELKQLQSIEKQLGLNRSEIIKGRVLHDSTSIIINASELMALLDSIGAELGRAGNNINQLARHANILSKQGTLDQNVVTEFNTQFGSYIQIQQELEKCLRQIIRLMRH
ncbi:MAG: plasmid mobilization relaxosome protein MobC [Bacteroidota bacterium]